MKIHLMRLARWSCFVLPSETSLHATLVNLFLPFRRSGAAVRAVECRARRPVFNWRMVAILRMAEVGAGVQGPAKIHSRIKGGWLVSFPSPLTIKINQIEYKLLVRVRRQTQNFIFLASPVRKLRSNIVKKSFIYRVRRWVPLHLTWILH